MKSEAQIREEKRSLRHAMRARLAAVSPEDGRAWSARISGHLLASDAYARARRVMLYWPLPGEVDLRSLAADAIASGREVILPRVDWATREIEACVVRDPVGELVVGRHGIMEPGPGCARAAIDGVNPLDLVVVPGLAFDATGGRLGRGAGFYDRFLARGRGARGGLEMPVCTDAVIARVVGVGFEVQVVARVPRDERDRCVDEVWTEGGRLALS
jgi:5-formyltetrahydrofolate cyclo-ligase